MYTDKTVTKLKAHATVACTVHTVLQKFTDQFRRYLVDHSHKYAGLLFMCTAEKADCGEGGEDGNKDIYKVVPSSYKLLSTSDKERRDVKLRVLHYTMEMILSRLKNG